jgi:hypothetical protein
VLQDDLVTNTLTRWIAEIAGRRGNEMLMLVCVGADDTSRAEEGRAPQPAS